MNTNIPPSFNEDLNETKKSPDAPTIKQMVPAVIVIVLIGIAIALLFIEGKSVTQVDQTSVAEVEKETQVDQPIIAEIPEDNSIKHYPYVLDYIKSETSHPSTVDFCTTLNLQTKSEKQPDGSVLYAYRNCMTAKNSYGVELKYDWVVVIQESTDGSIKVINSDIKEE